MQLAEYHPPPQMQQEDRLVFRPEVDRTRGRREPIMLLRNGSNNEEESTEGSDGPPAPKRARTDEDGLIAEAVLPYAVSVDDDPDLPTTYDEEVASDEAVSGVRT